MRSSTPPVRAPPPWSNPRPRAGSYSRHCFAWPLLQQTLAESIAGLEAAWQFFGGVPKRLILDNFSAAIAGPDALEPRLTRGFLEDSQERGFLCDPARVRKPKDKPHVERGIQYLRERFFKGGSFRSLEDCREQAERWCKEVAGLRVHDTTRQLPREVFEADEQEKLQPYDGVVYDVPGWKEVTGDHLLAPQGREQLTPAGPEKGTEWALGRLTGNMTIVHGGCIEPATNVPEGSRRVPWIVAVWSYAGMRGGAFDDSCGRGPGAVGGW